MNSLPYLSPTSIKKFFDSPEEFYMTYLAEERPPREPQQRAAAVGSAFDAYIKSDLHKTLYGPNHPEAAKHDRESLLKTQVQQTGEDYDLAVRNGGFVYLKYRDCGALADLIYEMEHATTEIRFEYDVNATVAGVPLRGKPDIFFWHNDCPVVYDWKVNGFYSAASPAQQYVKLYDCQKSVQKGGHKKTIHGKIGPFDGNLTPIEQYHEDWARQLCIYAWCEGAEVGDQIVAGIDQIVGRNKEGQAFPNLRVARFRSFISPEYQKKLKTQIEYIWECIKTGHIFRAMPRDESLEKQAQLEICASKLASGSDALRRISRSEGMAKWK